MTDDDTPTVTVQAPGVSIEVTDARTAEAALPFIEGALEQYLGENGDQPRRKQRRHKPVEIECDNCGYEWEYRGQSPNGTTCPSCNKHTRINPPLDERGLR